MKYISLLGLLLIGCSTTSTWRPERQLANFTRPDSVQFNLSLSSTLIFANGANQIFLQVDVKDSAGQPLKVSPKEVELITDVPVKIDSVHKNGDGLKFSFTPNAYSPDIRMVVKHGDDYSEVIELKATLSPSNDKLSPLPWVHSVTRFINGLFYTRQDNLAEGQYDGFTISNKGKNQIITKDGSYRSYVFRFIEQANEINSFMVNDIPNSTVSHSMHSHFMLFPRKYLPLAEVKDGKTHVTVSTGEKIIFDSETGEIVDGIFLEGPLDNTSDRFKRHYPDLKYQGKGILLRANARGQMPQQGEFESTSIDNEYGIYYSKNVLIFNGSTGERCRAPKSDFWSGKDESPIRFKYPTDKEFNEYLLKKCNFSIPELEIEAAQSKPDVGEDVERIWSRCQDSSSLKSCISEEVASIDDEVSRSMINFDMIQNLKQARLAEETNMNKILSEEAEHVRTSLLTDLSWVNDFDNSQKFASDCSSKSSSLVRNKLQFYNTLSLVRTNLAASCSTLKAEILSLTTQEVAGLELKISSDFSWAILNPNSPFLTECQKKGLEFVDSSFRYHSSPEIYTSSLRNICERIEISQPYRNWLKVNSIKFEEEIFSKLLLDIDIEATKVAESCLLNYPIDTYLNRVRYKRAREACLIEAWPQIEERAFRNAQSEPRVKRFDVSFDNLRTRVETETRMIQLRVLKKIFTI